MKSLPIDGVIIRTLCLLVLLCSMAPGPVLAQKADQESFSSPQEAVNALVQAMKASDKGRVMVILGPGVRDIIASGDETADREGREQFLRYYEEKNGFEKISDEREILTVGKENWPFPIPLIKKDARWVFNTEEGKEEIINRRIGRSELTAIGVCRSYVEAQREYASKDRDGDGILEYAQKLMSTEGEKDGLYWEAKEEEEKSPFGPLVAQAAQEGYKAARNSGTRAPYRGYFYKILKSQGKSAPGGIISYLVKKDMVKGFALLAYPAGYGTSGIMTFMVNQDGIVYEKDLGKDTEKIAQGMKVYDPDKSWKEVEDVDIK